MAVVLVAGKDPEVGSSIRELLEEQGLRARTVSSAEGALELLIEDPPDALVIGAMLEDQTGLALCRAARENPATQALPILMLTPSKSEIDRVLAFEAGADDAVENPFFPRELALRVRALLRARQQGSSPADRSAWSSGPLAIDLVERSVRVLGKRIELTQREFAVLAALTAQPGRVVTREELLQSVWGDSLPRTARVIDAHVKGLRRKLGPAGSLVQTVRGAGYRLSDSPAPTSLRTPAASE